MNLDILLERYFWVLLIAAHSFNGLVTYWRTRKFRKKKPELTRGYKQFLRWWLTLGNLPWVVIGLGILSKVTPNIWESTNLENPNPVSISFVASVFLIFIISTVWMLFGKGPDFFEKHPGLFPQFGPFRGKEITAKKAKRRYALFVVALFIMIVFAVVQSGIL